MSLFSVAMVGVDLGDGLWGAAPVNTDEFTALTVLIRVSASLMSP